MGLKIVRQDITKMNTEAIVNTANDHPTVGSGCDSAVYTAAGWDRLLAYRKKEIGFVPEGDVFITPAFDLASSYIIHAVSPFYQGGNYGEEEKLRSCYRKSLALAKEHHIRSISFPLISTGGFGYPKEEGFRIAVEEINAFLKGNDMEIYLVVFDKRSIELGKKKYPDLESYIDRHYVEQKEKEEYADFYARPRTSKAEPRVLSGVRRMEGLRLSESILGKRAAKESDAEESDAEESTVADSTVVDSTVEECTVKMCAPAPCFDEEKEAGLDERLQHLSDTFSEYLLYLIAQRGMENADVWKRALVDKKVFSKIKNNPEYHPGKLTALCLCVGAKLNLDETKDLLARAGYALSPCDKTDIIFSYFIENEIYDMIDLDIVLEDQGLPCIIS